MQNKAKLVELIKKELEEKKALDVQIFDMQNKNYFVDFVIVATSMGERHGLSLLDNLKVALRAHGEKFLNIDATGDWVVIDLGDILIHILSETFRVKYNLEEFLIQQEEIQKMRN